MKVFRIITLLICVTAIASCGRKEVLNTDIPGLGGPTWEHTDLDNWLYDNLTKPFNIEVKYKWDKSELELNKTLVPPSERNVQPMMDALKQMWIDTYIAEADSAFFKERAPKLLVMVGSPSYNADGSITLGTAEGGRRVVLYDVNSYSNTNEAAVKQMLHVVEHEFGHILHQTVLYPTDFKDISKGKYTANWINQSDDGARTEGFITAYAKSNFDDDFVETISIMLTEGRFWLETMANNQDAAAAAALRQKEQIVVNYFKTVWNIDYYSLQTRVQKALDKVTKRQLFSDLFGYDNAYRTILYNPAQPYGPSAGFAAIYNTANTNLQKTNLATLDSMKMTSIANGKMTMQLFYHNSSDNAIATYGFNVTADANNIIALSYVGADANGAALKASSQSLLDYFTKYHFSLQASYYAVGLVPEEDPTNFYAGYPLQ